MQPEDFLPRLAFIRYLYMHGNEQSSLPLTMGSSAILTWHDSVEMFLQLTAEHLNAKVDSRIDFDKYFVAIVNAPSGVSLVGKVAMIRFNKARVSLKHHGIFPSASDIPTFRNGVQSFMEDNTPLVFGIDFGAISMIDLVASTDAKTNLAAAQSLMVASEFEKALGNIALAFHYVVEDYEQTKLGDSFRSPFYFGASRMPINSHALRTLNRELATFVDAVQDSTRRLQSAVRILSLGLDYRRYARFRWHTPAITVMADGSRHIGAIPHLPISALDCQYCFDFVIETAIRFQNFDFEMLGPTVRSVLLHKESSPADGSQAAEAEGQGS